MLIRSIVVAILTSFNLPPTVSPAFGEGLVPLEPGSKVAQFALPTIESDTPQPVLSALGPRYTVLHLFASW